MGAKRASYSLAIAASPERCFAAITDYETFPDWQSPVKAVEVLSRDDDGRGRDVRFTIDAGLREVGYTLRYSYDPPHAISWDYLGGDVKSVDGDYAFEERDAGTIATYSLAIDPGVWLPGPVKSMLTDRVMKRSVEDLKRRVESDS
jgi:ribosome-associated toxin RatA of RatAB toxin-antitoxin module